LDARCYCLPLLLEKLKEPGSVQEITHCFIWINDVVAMSRVVFEIWPSSNVVNLCVAHFTQGHFLETASGQWDSLHEPTALVFGAVVYSA
jgi:hypothetical protein